MFLLALARLHLSLQTLNHVLLDLPLSQAPVAAAVFRVEVPANRRSRQSPPSPPSPPCAQLRVWNSQPGGAHFKKVGKSSDTASQPGQRQRPLTNKLLLPSGTLLGTRASDVSGGGLRRTR